MPNGAKGNRVASGFGVAPINVNGIGKGLKGAEGDADVQDDMQREGVHGDLVLAPSVDPVIVEEVGVLEVSEDSKFDDKGNICSALLEQRGFSLLDANSN